MKLLARQVCFHHPTREAAARCVQCRRFFCRECIAEHEDLLVCAECLAKVGRKAGQAGGWTWSTMRKLAAVVLGFICAWICFYGLGRALLSLPSEFHEPPPLEKPRQIQAHG